jgi:hypothetical protein
MNLCSSLSLKLSCLRYKYVSAEINRTKAMHCTEPRYSRKRHHISNSQDTQTTGITIYRSKIQYRHNTAQSQDIHNTGIILHRAKLQYRHHTVQSQDIHNTGFILYRAKLQYRHRASQSPDTLQTLLSTEPEILFFKHSPRQKIF